LQDIELFSRKKGLPSSCISLFKQWYNVNAFLSLLYARNHIDNEIDDNFQERIWVAILKSVTLCVKDRLPGCLRNLPNQNNIHLS